MDLCPVRAIKIYVDRSATYRNGRRKLFISFDQRHNTEIAPATLSSWLRNTIQTCYDKSNNRIRQEFNLTAHSIRGWSTSWAVTNRASISDVMSAVKWRAHTTFTSHYLRDVTNISDNMLCLGPVVTALHIS